MPDRREQTRNLLVNSVAMVDCTPYDGFVTFDYETGSFDGYALTVSVSDGFITIQAGTGAVPPKINFIKIAQAQVGSTIDATTSTSMQLAAVKATHDKAKMLPTMKQHVWGDYVDELVSYTTQKPRHAAVRYFPHSNSLYSIAATTNTAGAVVERYSYNTYGVRTVKNSAGAILAKSAVNQDRGFTSYKLDSETGLYFARSRMYAAKLGRFVSKDSVGYFDGLNLYSAYFAPNVVDPSGMNCVKTSIGRTFPPVDGRPSLGVWGGLELKLQAFYTIDIEKCTKKCSCDNAKYPGKGITDLSISGSGGMKFSVAAFLGISRKIDIGIGSGTVNARIGIKAEGSFSGAGGVATDKCNRREDTNFQMCFGGDAKAGIFGEVMGTVTVGWFDWKVGGEIFGYLNIVNLKVCVACNENGGDVSSWSKGSVGNFEVSYKACAGPLGCLSGKF